MAVQSQQLAGGDAGIAQTVRAMLRLIFTGKKNPDVHELAAGIVRSLPAYDDLATTRAIGEWVGSNVRFTSDVVDAETLHAAPDILRLRIGDCDDFTILICSLLETVGIPTRIITVSTYNEDPSQFSHVYPEAQVNGEWIAVDYARRNPALGRTPESAARVRAWYSSGRTEDLAGGNFSSSAALDRPLHLNGLGRAGRQTQLNYFPNALPGAYRPNNLNVFRNLRGTRPTAPMQQGHYGLGELRRMNALGDAGDIAMILQAAAPDITAATTGAANIIRAENTPSFGFPGGIPPGYQVNPLTGQLMQSSSIFGAGGMSTNTLLLLGAAAIAAVVLMRHR